MNETNEPKSILIVEDEVIVARDIKMSVEALGYTVAGLAHTGADAVEMAIGAEPDLVLMDIMLKGDMDGTAAAELIRERMDVPIVFLTAYSDEETLGRAKLSGPLGYILKPFEERELRVTIEIALYRHKMERELADARSRIKILQGLIPICAGCKKIRDDKGFWNQLEVYIKEHSEADFTHGFCPECAKKMMDEYKEGLSSGGKERT